MASRCTQSLMVRLLVSQIFVYGLTSHVFGQGVTMLNDDASPCAIFLALSPQVPPQCQERSKAHVRYRSIVMQQPETAPPQAPRIYAFATTIIPFAWDSARLTPEAYRLLDNLAEVLKNNLMADKIIHIEGHTDSSGAAEYNMLLSYKRALAVQRYLSEQRSVPIRSIPALGKGKTEPYDPAHPLDASNRRVQFINVSDTGGRQ